ncbi:hypothetical protein [Anatilimnocola floriformis]|uniref:hypothetical protein n=1 Tax=Anatilimnocola floriformis TaxID=2948575 RepID=UPI0020C327B1|nr:hypothetical protein [Anatilimnocola floriformis]
MKTFQLDQYQIAVGGTSYPVRLMLGRVGYFGEWYCPHCQHARNSEPKPVASDARKDVFDKIAAHHAEDVPFASKCCRKKIAG